ncbi:MAG: T9SS type A sorting domain-containing protein [Chitinophagaceae bacterium]|nr:T9SS type A sorting domain-containing protein [Chitinophagaceae bacterium]
MRILKQLLLAFSIICFTDFYSLGQANPFINVLPSNSGVVPTGGIIDIIVTIGNTGPVSTVPQAKLRPIIQVPPSVTFLPNAQQTGLPVGWTILSNTGSQLRVCNSTDPIPVNTSRTITLKVQGVTVTGPQTFSGNINFGNGTTCAAGPTVAGDVITDNSATSTIEVVPGCNLGVSATAGTIVCHGDSTTITCAVTNPTGAVEYNISGTTNYQSSNLFVAPAGTYTLTAREVSNPLGCIVNTTIVITEPDSIPTTVVNIIEPTCTNSLATVTVTSDTLGLTYSIDGGAFASYPPTGYVLGSGAHTILSRNASNCSPAITNFTISAQPPTPAPPIIDTVIQPTCSISTGSIQLSNLPAGQWTLNPGNVSSNTTTTIINTLPAGNYSFTVTNSFGCTSSNAAPVTINTVLGAPLAPVVTVTQPTCAVSTGSVTITSPDPNLTYSLDGGAFTAYPAGGYLGVSPGSHSLIAQAIGGCLSPFTYVIIDPQPVSPTMPVVTITQPNCTVSNGVIVVVSDTTGLTFSLDGAPYSSYPANGYMASSGSHTLEVQNSSGCAPTVLNNIVINPQPQTPVITASSTPITCFGDYSTITLTATGGVLPYEFSMNDTIFQPSNIFVVPAGSYNFTVKDSNGCSNKTDTIFLTQPLPITGTVTATPINCHGDSSMLTITASGGVGALEYSLNSGLYQPSNSFVVPAGDYKIDIRLIANPACYAAVSPQITITQPEKLKLVASYEAIKYCGDSALIKISANGGIPPYTGLGDFVKGPGVWTFTVVDNNGCSTTSDITLLPPGCVELNLYPNPASNSISINHSAAGASGAIFQIVSDIGSKLLSFKVPENSFNTTIDISALSRGVYFLVYVNGEERKVAKFTKVGK